MPEANIIFINKELVGFVDIKNYIDLYQYIIMPPPVIGSPLLGFIRDLYSYSVRSCWCTQKEGTFTGTFLKTL